MDIIVHAFAFFKNDGIDICHFVRYFTRDTGLNDVVAPELICCVQ